MARTNEFTEVLVDWIDGRLRQSRFSNLWLGGGPGANGGTNYRPVDGQLTQRHVCYDTSEDASPCSPSGFSSLVDNLRRIRYWQEPATWFGAETTSGLQIYIKPGLWYPSTTEYCAFAGGNSPTFTLPGVLDRIDTVYVDPSGVLHIQRGTPAVLPTITLPPIASGIPLWAVHLTPTSSGITHIECSGYYTGMGYIERDLRPFLNLGGGGAVASGVLPATTAEGQALVSNAALEWVADTTPLWKGEHSFEDGIAFVGATTENSVTIPNAQTQAYHIIDTGATEFLRIDTYNEYFLINPAGTGVKVGIGLSVPDLNLHVHGANSVTIKLTNDDTGIAGNVGFDIGVATNESVYMWNRENTELSLGTNNTRRLTILAGGEVGIAVAAPEGQLDVAYGVNFGKMTLLLGAYSTTTARNNNTAKRTVIGSYHYTNAEEPLAMLYAYSSGVVSRLDIGGGHIYCNAATKVSIYTAANTTTTTGTERFSVSSTGAITVTGPSLEVPDEWWVGIGAAAERIIFDSAGDISFMGCNVGVGVITPNQQLTVEGTIDLKEQAAANADVASYGQIWVKNTAPNELWFTDDTGADIQLGVGGGGLPAVAGAGYALVSDGVDSWAADQTPAWTGKHSFGAAIAFTGGSGANVISAPDNIAQALQVYDTGATEYLRIVTTNGFEEVIINAAGDDVNFTVQAIGVADALSVQGSDGQIILGVLTAGYVKSSAAGVLSVATEVPLIDLGSYTQGDLIYGGAADWQDLAIGGIGDFLWVNAAGTEPEWHTLVAGDIPAHTLLGTQHSDTATDAPTRGSMITGNATPAWDELVHPGTAYHLQTSVTDIFWSQNIAMADGVWIGIGALTERIIFDGTNGDITVMGANFGVGTTAPGGTIDVAGEIRITADDVFAAGVAQVYTDATNGLILTGHAGTTYDFLIAEASGHVLFVNPVGTDNVILCVSTGDVGIACTPGVRLDVKDDVANFIGKFFNDGNNNNRWGLIVQCGLDTNPASRFINFSDGNGTTIGYIIGSGAGGVTYWSASDERRKNILGPIDPVKAMRALTEVDAIQYVGKGLTAKTGRRNVGFSAQEIHRHFPEVATYDEKEDLYGISYERLVTVLWTQNQALLKRIEMLETK